MEGRLIVRLCTRNVHPHTHPQFVLYCSEREEKGSRASVTHAFGDVYNMILCSGASFPFLLSPNCERATLRLCADRQLRNVPSGGCPCDYPGNPFLPVRVFVLECSTRLNPVKRRSNRKLRDWFLENVSLAKKPWLPQPPPFA